jgi:hypothetical protein
LILAPDTTPVDNQVAHHLIAITRILFERLIHDKPQYNRDIRVHATNLRRWPVNDLLDTLQIAGRFKRPPPGKHLEKHDAKNKPGVLPGVDWEATG